MTGDIHANTNHALADYTASLDRCTSRAGFLDRFYELFLNSSEEVREKFKNTNFDRQKQALRSSLCMLMTVHEWSLECDAHFAEIAERHSRRELDIPSALYDLWLTCLLQTVREFDPQCDAEIETAWKKVLQPSIDLMKLHY